MSINTNYDETYYSFEDMHLKEELLRGIYGYGFERPLGLQRRAIKPLINHHDLLCRAQSGTGKTATYCIGIIQNIDVSLNVCQTLIISPTRELAMGISQVCKSLGDFLHVKSYAVVGGTKVSVDMSMLSSGVHIVVGTSGRLLDMMMKGILRVDRVKTLVFDEMDEILARGFGEQLQTMVMRMPGDIQIAIFTCTFPSEIACFTNHFLHNPITIHQDIQEKTLEGIKQYYIAIDREDWKVDTLLDFFDTVDITQTVIYINNRRKVEAVAAQLREKGMRVSMTHGDMDQHTRLEQIREFRTGSTRFHLTTDLIRNEIDAGITVFINYDMPTHKETYLMRIGRSGHYGRKGFSLLFVLPSEVSLLKELENYYNTHIEELPMDLDGLL